MKKEIDALLLIPAFILLCAGGNAGNPLLALPGVVLVTVSAGLVILKRRS